MTPPSEPVLSRAEVRAASAALGSRLGEPIGLSDLRLVKEGLRSRTARAAVSPPVLGRETVMVRVMKREFAQGFSDWASLEYLSLVDQGGEEGKREGAPAVAPRFVAGDVERRLLVVEDLGVGRDLDAILNGDDGGAVGPALEQLGSAMGRLARIGRAPGRFGQFELLRRSLPEWQECGREGEVARWQVGLERVRAWFRALGVGVPPELAAVAEAIAGEYRSPGPRLAFSHGDPAPSNNFFTRERCCLIDFEYGGLRHELYDLSGWNVLCPLPAPLLARLVAAFRSELPELDDERFERGWHLMCAFRALAVLGWLPTAILAEDRPWAGTWSCQSAAAVAMARLSGALAGLGRTGIHTDSETSEEAVRERELFSCAEAFRLLLLAYQARVPRTAELDGLLPRWRALGP